MEAFLILLAVGGCLAVVCLFGSVAALMNPATEGDDEKRRAQ